MKKILVLIIFFISLIIPVLSFPQNDSETCNNPPDQEGPPPDTADDNFSFNSGGVKTNGTSYNPDGNPFIGILKNGNFNAMGDLLKSIGRKSFGVKEEFYPQKILKHINLLIIPTGGLMGMSNSGNFKLLLTDFLERGGMILCFAQQDSLDFQALPIPVGESLHAMGWRNSQSCYQGSIYFSQTGPIFSGQTSQRISAGVDGGFSSFPAGTSVLIRRTANQEPALIAYPYGVNGGAVYLSAAYPDWSLLHGACTLSELKLVRDLLSYLKNIHLQIPMFDVSTNPTAQVQLNVKIKNTTEFTASKALLKTYTPFRDRVVFETEQSISLPPAGEIEVPVSFTLTDVQTEDLGIYGTYYELLDSEGNQVLNSIEVAIGNGVR